MRYTDLIQNARKARANGNLQEAIKYYKEAFNLKIMVEDLVDYGLLHLDNNQPIQAIQIFHEIIESLPQLAYVYYYLGISYEQIGKRTDATKYFLEAISREQNFPEAYFSLALIADEDGDEKKAYDYYKKTLLYDSDHFWANLNLGSFYEKHDYLELALDHTLHAYKLFPEEKMIAYNLGVIYSKLKKYDQARDYYLEEINKNGYSLAYLNLALLYKDKYQDYESARYYYLEGISKDKDNAILWYNLACVYILMDDYENAYSCLLYALIRDRKLKDFLHTDPELSDFINTEYYQRLMKEIG